MILFLEKTILKYGRLIEIFISVIVILTYYYIIRLKLHTLYFYLTYEDNDVYYVNGEPKKLNLYEQFIYLIDFEQTLFLILTLIILFGIFQIIRRKKIGLLIIQGLLLLIIIPSIMRQVFLYLFKREIDLNNNTITMFITSFWPLIIAIIFFYFTRLIIKVYK